MDPDTPRACIPYLARAKELEKREPVVAYWAKFMAAKLALDQLDTLNEGGRAVLETLMGDLEESKASMADNELVTDDAAGSAYIFNFASRVFEGADRIDRAGKATRATAKEFLAASNFFETLAIFGPLEPDVSEKITYAKWKASSISKAFREGRTPTPGPANAAPAAVPSSSTLSRDGSAQSAPAQHNQEQEREHDPESDEVLRQLLKKENEVLKLPEPNSRPPSSTNVYDLAHDNDEQQEGVNGHAPPAAGNVYDLTSDDNNNNDDVPIFSLPSAPRDDDDIDDGFNASLPSVPKAPAAGRASSSTFPSAPPDMPSFPSAPSASSFKPTTPSAPPPSSRPSQPRAPVVASSRPSQPPAHSTYAAPAPPRPTSTNKSADGDSWRPTPTTVDPDAMAACQKHAKFAISALNYEDVETARKELKKALALLGEY